MSSIQWAKVGDHDLPVPSRATDGAAGYDLMCNDACAISTKLKPGDMRVFDTGWGIAIPDGYVGLVRDRSGMTKRGMTTRAGVIDSDYCGEIKVILVNESESWHVIRPGDRIAQLLIVPIAQMESVVVDELPDTERGTGGFGSTGR